VKPFVIDIETIPTQRDDLAEFLTDDVTAPGQYKKPESIEKWMVEHGEQAKKELLQKTALNGLYGEIVTFGAVFEGLPSVHQRQADESEHDFLWELNGDLGAILIGTAVQWIGWNIGGFDLRFLWQRFIINGIQPKFTIPFDAKPWDKKYLDLMAYWCGFGKYAKLVDVCRVFGIEHHDDIDGSQVFQAWQEGRQDDIQTHCKADILRTAELHQRMVPDWKTVVGGVK
jgi:hypothetical protein